METFIVSCVFPTLVTSAVPVHVVAPDGSVRRGHVQVDWSAETFEVAARDYLTRHYSLNGCHGHRRVYVSPKAGEGHEGVAQLGQIMVTEFDFDSHPIPGMPVR